MNKEEKRNLLIEIYIKGHITYEELLRSLEELDELPPPPVIY